MTKWNDWEPSDDDEEDEDDFDKDDAERMAEEIVHNSKAAMDAEIKIAEKTINLDLLDFALRIAKSNWSWWFLSHRSKIARIEEVVDRLKDIVK